MTRVAAGCRVVLKPLLLSVTVDFKCTYLQFKRIISILSVSSPICKYHCKETHYPWSGYLTQQDLDWKERKKNNFQWNSQQPCFSNSSSSDVDWLWDGHKTYEANNINYQRIQWHHDKPEDRQGAVYKIKCSNCQQATYIGETGRNLSTRLTEHKWAMRNGDVINHIAVHHYRWNINSTGTLRYVFYIFYRLLYNYNDSLEKAGLLT